MLAELMEQVIKMFEEKDLIGPDTTSFELAIGLLKNNTIASFVLMLTGFLPVFVPAIGILAVNSAVLGIFFAYMKMNGQAVAPMFLAGIVPHGIFEITAIVLAGALAFYISIGIIKRIGNTQYSLKERSLNAFKTFLYICLPLLIIAAFIEAYITPVLLGMVT